MNPPRIFLALDVATLVCAALLGVAALPRIARSAAARWLVAICLCNICHVLLARQEYAYWIPAPYQIELGAAQPAFALARNLTPGLIMLFSHALFSETRRFPPWLAGLFGLQILLEEPVRWLGLDPGRLAQAHLVAAVLQMVFAAAAAWWAFESWRVDLVEARRRLRALTLLVVGLDVVGANLLLRVIIPPDIPANYQVHVALVAINLAILATLVLRLSTGGIGAVIDPVPRAAATPPPRPRAILATETQSAAAMARLARLLRVERIYSRPGITLRALADEVGLPEYRLRRLIHEGLGYRNFNRLLHEHRIRDACDQLADPARRRVPILTIALSVGYQSINTFNRGFGEVMGMTPSAYRAEADLVETPAKTAPKTE